MDDTQTAGPFGTNTPTSANERPSRGQCRSIAFQMAAVALTFVSALAGTGLARLLRAPEPEADKTVVQPGTFPGKLFKDWTKPDLVIVLSAQQKGYLLPCGCSTPQVGGLERRYNLLEMIKAAGWTYVAADLGDIAQRDAPANLPNEQGPIKYRYSMKALKTMNYSAIAFGENEVNLGLFNLLADYALNEKQPRVVAGNLMNAEENYPEMTAPWQLAAPPGTRIRAGITSVTGPRVAERIKELARADPKLKFEKSSDSLNRILGEMAKEKVDLPILLFQGPVTRNAMKKPYTEAMACAEAFPQFPIVVALSDEDEASSRPTPVKTKSGTESMVVSLGRKGKFIGVIGVFKTGKVGQPLRFEFERVELTEKDFKTPKAKEKGHPIVEMMESYTQELKSGKYLENHGRIRHALQVMPKVPGLTRDVAVEYSGSEKCKGCHPDAYNIWKKTPHSHAYSTLVKADRPANRQFDPECIVCHTVGFGVVSGYVNEEKTPKLKDVGCESCHGPSSAHVANPNDLTWQKRVNPWKYLPKANQKLAMDMMCQKCHDIDNDVNWINNAFDKKWPKVAHPTEKAPEEKEKDK